MLARGEYRMEIRRVMQDVDVAVRQQSYEAAVRMLEDAIRKTDRANHLLLAEYHERLRELLFVYLKDYGRATQVTARLRDIEKQITRIRALG